LINRPPGMTGHPDARTRMPVEEAFDANGPVSCADQPIATDTQIGSEGHAGKAFITCGHDRT
jgi:hypothetical protein